MKKNIFLSSDFCCYGQYWPNVAWASVEKKFARIPDNFHIKMCFFIELYLQVGNSFVNMIYANFCIFSNLFYEFWVCKFFHEFMGIYMWGSEKKIIQKYILMCQEMVLYLSTLKNCNWFFSILDPFFILLSRNFASNGLLWVLYRKGSFVTYPGCPLPQLVGLWIPCRSRRSCQTYWLMDLHLALRLSYAGDR